MRHRPIIGSVLAAVLLVAGLATSAVAQEYPPPVPGGGAEAETCVAVEGEVGDEFVVGQAEYQGEVHVSGSEGAAGEESDVDFFAEPGHIPIGSVTPLEDGSYSGTLTLPSSLQPGTYEIGTDVASCTETAALQVLSASGEGGGTDVLGTSASNDDGTAVLGASGENSDGGNLPVTGSNILDLILLALALIVIGAGVRWWAKRRRAGRAAGIGFFKSRPLALPSPSVPHLDTRGFQVSVAARHNSVETAAAPVRSVVSSVRSTWTPEGSTSAPSEDNSLPEEAPTTAFRTRTTRARTKTSTAKRKPSGRKPKSEPEA